MVNIRALLKILLCNKNFSMHKRMKSSHFASSGVIIDLLVNFSVRIIFMFYQSVHLSTVPRSVGLKKTVSTCKVPLLASLQRVTYISL